MVQKLVLVLIHLTLLVNVVMYDQTCPSHAEWTIRSTSVCNSTAEYLCLYDIINEQYVEQCEGPRWDRIGAKRIISGSITRGDCSLERFQPFKFWTNGSSDCAFGKSVCTEDGQLVYNNGSAMEDRSCRCDHSRSYAFLQIPSNIHNCFPATEDCTCYMKTCPRYFQLSLNYECIPTSTSTEISANSTYELSTVSWTKNVGIRDNKATWNYAHIYWKEGATLSIIFFTCFMTIVVLVVFVSHSQKLKKRVISIVLHVSSILPEPIKKSVNTYMEVDSSSCHLTVPKPRSAVSVNRMSDQLGLADTNCLNYLRLTHLLFRVATPLLRMKFDQEFHPDQLQKFLLDNKMKLHDQLMITNRISQDQWNILCQTRNGKTVSSEDFDLRLMICLIGVLSGRKIGKLRPVPIDMRPDANISRIRFIRNIITQSLTGHLSDEEFLQNYTDLSQAILRLGTTELQLIDQTKKENEQLVDRLLQLNPLNYNKENLHRLYAFVEECYPELLKEIIKQYCTLRQTSLKDLLEEEKHKLFHLRHRSKSCCECGKDISRTLSEHLWKQLYDQVKQLKFHPGKESSNDKTCFHFFATKHEIDFQDLDATAAVSLILRISGLFGDFCDRFFSSGFDGFLNKHKHAIYHAMSPAKCCECIDDQNTFSTSKMMIDEGEWSILFTARCLNYTHTRKKSNLQTCSLGNNCCCNYLVVDGIRHSAIDKNILCRILKISGPFHHFDSIGKMLFQGTIDDDCLVKIIEETRETLDALVNVISDEVLRTQLNEKISSFNQPQINVERSVKVQKWVFKQLHHIQLSESTIPITSVIVRNRSMVDIEKGCHFTQNSNHSHSLQTKDYFTKTLRLVKRDDSVIVKEGEKGFYLECEVKDPDQSASWLKNGNDLRPGLQKIVEGTTHRLEIPEFLIDDSGTYTVCINNHQRQIKIEVEGGWILKTISGKESEASILHKRTFVSLSNEECNFLKIVYLLMRIVCSALREGFDKECPPNKLNELLLSLYHGVQNDQDTSEHKNDKGSNENTNDQENTECTNENGSKKQENDKTEQKNNQGSKEVTPCQNITLTKTQMDILYPASGTTSSKCFDLKLMIFLLEQHYKQQDKSDDIVVDNEEIKSFISKIKTIRRNIMNSPTGLLSDTQFQEYSTTLIEAAICLGGEKYREMCSQMKLEVPGPS